MRSTLNVFLKKKLKEPILQNTRKLVVQVSKADSKSYDQEYNQLVDDEEDFDEIDFGYLISKQHRKLTSSSFSTRNAAKRSQEYRMDRFENTKAFKKLSCIYFPVDKTQKISG